MWPVWPDADKTNYQVSASHHAQHNRQHCRSLHSTESLLLPVRGGSQYGGLEGPLPSCPPLSSSWTGGTKSSAGWLFCFSTAAINLNIWIKLSDPKAALAKGNILRGKNMNTLGRVVGWRGDKSWLECWRCHFRVKTRTNCLHGGSAQPCWTGAMLGVESEVQSSPMLAPALHHNLSTVSMFVSVLWFIRS